MNVDEKIQSKLIKALHDFIEVSRGCHIKAGFHCRTCSQNAETIDFAEEALKDASKVDKPGPISIEIGCNRHLQVSYDGNDMSKATIVLTDTSVDQFPIALTKDEALQLSKAIFFMANAMPDEQK